MRTTSRSCESMSGTASSSSTGSLAHHHVHQQEKPRQKGRPRAQGPGLHRRNQGPDADGAACLLRERRPERLPQGDALCEVARSGWREEGHPHHPELGCRLALLHHPPCPLRQWHSSREALHHHRSLEASFPAAVTSSRPTATSSCVQGRRTS